MSASHKGWIFLRAHKTLAAIAALYCLIIAFVLTPLIQTHVLYAHRIHFFGYSGFEHPENYGLAPGKAVNLKLRSSDNTTLGAWFIFSDNYHRRIPFPEPPASPRQIPSAIAANPTILFLHGNTGTRALPLRISVYSALTARLDANVLAIDYRGFGDSGGHPTIEGVSRDARAGWNYLMQQGSKPEDVLIIGHSLGTAIAGLLAAQLAKDGIQPRGVVLMSAFSSVRSLMDTYSLFGFLPLLKPISMIPWAPRLVTWSLIHNFDTLSLVPDIKSSVLIVHAEDDWDIPHAHASLLFDAFLEPHLTLSEPMTIPPSPADAVRTGIRAEQRRRLVSSTTIPNFGRLDEFSSTGRKVAMLKTTKGGHDIGRLEGVQDTIRRMFDFAV
ncbi:Alpha/Beta hydrolase protein [Infundibulicybe gibba]|nr:Alpha/Beta hydrolase protein [Infundibulicybe gibba]